MSQALTLLNSKTLYTHNEFTQFHKIQKFINKNKLTQSQTYFNQQTLYYAKTTRLNHQAERKTARPSHMTSNPATQRSLMSPTLGWTSGAAVVGDITCHFILVFMKASEPLFV
ncbi:hypothetical protein ILYODFUR_009512 [Ilyodon furcidens]|uniref:Uncharacterized protein n=1 Tax=Ilyodon furcidens TaxID=33524 RepID=A0ABV0TK70_9TELE